MKSAPKNIILAGFMGSGKSTVGRIVAARLGWEFLDTDDLIESRENASISEIFASRGEPAFREMESAIARELSSWTNRVVATGGGFMLRPENREAAARAGLVVLLVASPDEIWHRVGRSRHRPLLQAPDPRARIGQMLEERQPAYDQIPLKIATDGMTTEQVADAIVKLLRTE